MKPRVLSNILSAVIVSSLAVTPLPAHAQGGLEVGGSMSNFGRRHVSQGGGGFAVRVIAGGDIDAAGLGIGHGCVGHITARPDFIVTFDTDPGGRSVQFSVPNPLAATESDTTLIVHTPSGDWRCNDDANGLNPSVGLSNGGAGQYEIWVGTIPAHGRAEGRLQVTSDPHGGGGSVYQQPHNQPMGRPPVFRVIGCDIHNTGILGIGDGRRTEITVYNEGDSYGAATIIMYGQYPGGGRAVLATTRVTVPAHNQARTQLSWNMHPGLLSISCAAQ